MTSPMCEEYEFDWDAMAVVLEEMLRIATLLEKSAAKLADSEVRSDA